MAITNLWHTITKMWQNLHYQEIFSKRCRCNGGALLTPLSFWDRIESESGQDGLKKIAVWKVSRNYNHFVFGNDPEKVPL